MSKNEPKPKPDHDIRFSYHQPSSAKSLADATKREKAQARDQRFDAVATRTGRGVLWAFAPPLGLWRSWKHGQKKRDAKLAESIAEEITKRQK